MWVKMRERGIEVPKLAGQDMADILSYLYVSHYFEQTASRARGQKLVQDRGCTACHSVRGKGGKLAADFATSTVVGSPASLIAGMWNHAVYMEAKAQTQNIAWPALKGQELADIAAYLNSLSKAGGTKSQPK
jgi:mono/diheme cytochrome c family protein